MIEEHNPDIEFDWPQILKGQDEAPTGRPDRPDRPERTARPERRERLERPGRPPADREPQRPQPSAPAAGPPIAPEPINPAHARVGSEGLARLRARYADIRARIARRVPDDPRREALETEAERLNPDAWVTDEEVQRGLDQYDAAFESLAATLGRRRRRRGRGGRPAEPGAVGPGDAAGGSRPAGEPRADGHDDGPGAGAVVGDEAAGEEEEEEEVEGEAGDEKEENAG
jgi:hypothetical protein